MRPRLPVASTPGVAPPLPHRHLAADHLFERLIGERLILFGFRNLFGFGNRLVGFRGILRHFGLPQTSSANRAAEAAIGYIVRL